MRLMHAILAATMAAMLAVAVGVMADEDVVVKKEIKIITDANAGAIQLDVADLEVGESRQILTDDGKEVVVTRTEEGYELEIDGEEIEIGGPGHNMVFHGQGGEHGGHKVIVKHLEMDDSTGYHFISADGEGVEVDLDETFQWVQSGGGHEHLAHVLALGHPGERAAAHLEESGVLDDLDDAKRQEILDALKSFVPHVGHGDSKMVVIKVDHDSDDDSDGE